MAPTDTRSGGPSTTGTSLDLGSAPEGESKIEKAERIYLAHQRAGVELLRPNLALWAGYQNEGSGRTQYLRLERLYGPIVVRKDADDPDFVVPPTAQPVPTHERSSSR